MSAFNQVLPDYPEQGSSLVHNTFSGAYVVLPSAELSLLRARDVGPTTGGVEPLPGDDELLDPDVGILVESPEIEETEFQEWFAKRRRRSILDVVVGVNLACNFACTYCSQKDVLDGSVMKPATADATGDWLANRVLDEKLPAIRLSFVGGEPLLHPDRIERIVARIRDRVGASVAVSFSVTTNGYLVTQSLIDRLTAIGLDHMKITLDGDETTHSLTRVAKNGEDTFRRTLDSVLLASRSVRVTVNGNYEPRTVAGFRPLVDRLSEAGFPRGSKVSFTPALAAFGHAEGDGEAGGCTWGSSELSQHVSLQSAVDAAGFESTTLGVVGPCEFHDVQAFAIGIKGQIYKCPGFLGHSEWAIGTVRDGLTERYHTMLELTPKSDPCGGCSDRPKCGGGCIAAAWLRTGSTDEVNCEKPYFDAVRSETLASGLAAATGEEVPRLQPRRPAPPVNTDQHPTALLAPARRPLSLRVVA